MQPKNHKAFYDLCLSVIVAEKPNHDRMSAISFGIFDGPFPSLEPYDFSSHGNLPTELKKFETQNLFQIFDVELSSIATSSDAGTAYALMASWEDQRTTKKRYKLSGTSAIIITPVLGRILSSLDHGLPLRQR